MQAVSRPAGLSNLVISRRDAIAFLLNIALFVSLFRASTMWVGYPSGQDEFGTVDPFSRQVVLYSLIPILTAYVIVDAAFVAERLKRLSLPVCVALLLIILSVATSENAVASARALAAVILVSLPPIFFYWRFGSDSTQQAVCRFCMGAILLNTVYTLLLPHYGIMSGALAGSVRGMFLHKNAFAQFNAFAVFFLLPRRNYSGPKTLEERSRLFFAALALVSVAVSRSSTGVGLVVIGALVWLAVLGIRSMPTIYLRSYALALLAILLGAAVFIVLQVVLPLVTELLGRDATLSGRTGLWSVLIQVAMDQPILGHGFGMFRQPDVLEKYASAFGWEARSTHNSYLELALNMGFPAAVLVVALIGAALARRVVLNPLGTPGGPVAHREAVIIAMIMTGALTEAGCFLAPLLQWPLLLSVSCRGSPIRQRE